MNWQRASIVGLGAGVVIGNVRLSLNYFRFTSNTESI